jgi:Domain of unknown function (DUF4386)
MTQPSKPVESMLTDGKESMSEEKSVLRWGGLAGMLGGIVFIFVPVILFGFVPPAPADPSQLVARFPAVRMAIAAGNFVDFVSDVLVLALFLALYRALRKTSPAAALFGSVISILGLAVIFTETATQVAFDPISNLYHAPAATPADQATLALIWQATQGMFNQFDTAAVLLLSTGFIVLGVAMIRAPAFGKGVGGLSVAFGAVAFVGGFIFGVTSVLAALLVVPVFIILPILLGWKVYNLSRSP